MAVLPAVDTYGPSQSFLWPAKTLRLASCPRQKVRLVFSIRAATSMRMRSCVNMQSSILSVIFSFVIDVTLSVPNLFTVIHWKFVSFYLLAYILTVKF